MSPRQSLFGHPLPFPRSKTTVLIVEPTLGFNASQPETDLPLGQTPEVVNFTMRDGALEPRSRLSTVLTNPRPMAITVTGGYEAISSLGTFYPVISGTTRWAWYSNTSWSVLSYVSANGISAPPSGATTDYYDMTQTYYPVTDEMLVVGANGSYQTLFCWSVGSTLLSSMTGAPRAKYVTTFDNFVLAFNIRDVGSAQSRYVQRVQWNHRGSPMLWSGSTTLAGSEDLLSARGEGTRIMELDNRVILFFEQEIWQGIRNPYPNTFVFSPVDRTVGTAFSWTIVKTPLGLVFLGGDYNIYLLPKDGGVATPIGNAVQRRLRTTIDSPDKAWAVYDAGRNTYQLYYPVRGGTNVPTKRVDLNITDGTYTLHSFVVGGVTRSLTRGFPAHLQSATAALTYDDLTTQGYTFDTIPYTYDQMGSAASVTAATIFLGSSDGTMYHLSSIATTDDGTAVEARWRTGALGPETPESVKMVNQVRVDGQAEIMSAVTVRASRDQGANFDPGQALTFNATSNQTQVVAHLSVPARYPTIEVTTEDIGIRLFRLWVPMRIGGQ